MSQEKIDKLHELEKTAKKLREVVVRTEERLLLLREQRDFHVKELAKHGIKPKDVQKRLTEMSNAIDKEIAEIEAQIPPNLEELLRDEEPVDGSD